jgi:hypothetical protein
MKTKTDPDKGFADIRRFSELKGRLVEENEEIQDYFRRLEVFIKEKGLSGEILNRHAEFVRQYTTKYEALTANLNDIESAHNAISESVRSLPEPSPVFTRTESSVTVRSHKASLLNSGIEIVLLFCGADS